jgi:hypothetical protein
VAVFLELIPKKHLKSGVRWRIFDERRVPEIFKEGLVRQIASFAQFFDIAAFSNGETLNSSPRPRKMTLPDGNTIDIRSWRAFLQALWKGKII